MPAAVSAWACRGKGRKGEPCENVFATEHAASECERGHAATAFELVVGEAADYCRNNDYPPEAVAAAMAVALPYLLEVLHAAGVIEREEP
jgi:hypothetical protein